MATADLMVPAIREFVASMLTELPKDTESLDTYLAMSETDPVIGSALHYIALASTQGIGEYHHPDPEIEAGIRAQFQMMGGSLNLSFEELVASAYAIGYGVSQWGVQPGEGLLQGKLQLIDIQIVNPRDYNFRGSVGAIQDIMYRSGSLVIPVPYSGPDGRICHVVNARHLAYRSPKGSAALKRCVGAWKAWKIIMGEMVVAAQRQATPILVGYSDSGVRVPLLDSLGQPLLIDGAPQSVEAPTALLRQLETLDNRSVLSTDLRNRVEALHSEAGGMFFFEALKMLDQYKLRSLLVPATIFDAYGSGDSNLNKGQRHTLDLVISALVDQTKETILEGPIRFLIEQNHGPQETLGEFVVPEQDESSGDRAALLTAIQGAVVSGLLPAADPGITDRAYELIGVQAPIDQAVKAVTSKPGPSVKTAIAHNLLTGARY